MFANAAGGITNLKFFTGQSDGGDRSDGPGGACVARTRSGDYKVICIGSG
ncbi:hypothetical protein ABIB75_001200 [Bradyrhizobium sp. GM2.2]|jgi:hypothetical protein